MNRIILFIFSFCLFLFSLGCSNNRELKLREKEAELKQRELELKEKEQNKTSITSKLSNNDNQNIKNSFAYVLVEVDEPEVYVKTEDLNKSAIERWERRQNARSEASSNSLSLLPDIIEPRPQSNYFQTYHEIPQIKYYKSEIQEISDLSEDNRYRIIDRYISGLKSYLQGLDKEYSFKIQHKRTSVIKSKNLMVFDTYAAASKSRNNN